jgi:hypothetical protein
MDDTATTVFFVFYLPYLLAIVLAQRARSQGARRLVFVVAPITVAVISIFFALTYGCSTTDFRYHACPLVADPMAGMLIYVYVILFIVHVFFMPLLALVAVLLEWWSRRAPKQIHPSN